MLDSDTVPAESMAESEDWHAGVRRNVGDVSLNETRSFLSLDNLFEFASKF